MSAQDWTILIGVITTSVVTVWGAWSAWSDRRKKVDQEQERLRWEVTEREAEAAHRRKMEELQMVAIRQGGAAAKAAEAAKKAAIVSGAAVNKRIDESAQERKQQMEAVSGMIEDNTRTNEQAIVVANHFKSKLVDLSEAIAEGESPGPKTEKLTE